MPGRLKRSALQIIEASWRVLLSDNRVKRFERIFRSMSVQKNFGQFRRNSRRSFRAWDQSISFPGSPESQQAGGLSRNSIIGQMTCWNTIQDGKGIRKLSPCEV